MKIRLYGNKRGLSPLIATVILIALAVSLGAVVMNLSAGFLGGNKQLSDQKECTGMKLIFHDLNGPQVTFSGAGASGSLGFVVNHVGTEPIPQLRLIVIGSKDGQTTTFVSDLDSSITEPGIPLSKQIAYDYEVYGNPNQVEVVPLANRGTKKLACLGGEAKYIVQ
ncbi:MAG TPA: archaellin/type IV pilin N-terminal domain-containing protein [Candidatus Nanoarchaeia archaeon]|nr:archaellin/type IV pilin N-terminal domain-containing protein [Candidatus Nanoarchaeia archaeon]